MSLEIARSPDTRDFVTENWRGLGCILNIYSQAVLFLKFVIIILNCNRFLQNWNFDWYHLIIDRINHKLKTNIKQNMLDILIFSVGERWVIIIQGLDALVCESYGFETESGIGLIAWVAFVTKNKVQKFQIKTKFYDKLFLTNCSSVFWSHLFGRVMMSTGII